MLHQDTSLLSGSLRLCLDPAGKLTDAQLWQILQLLELQGIKVLIKRLTLSISFSPGELSDGLDIEVEDGAVGGVITPTDRQLISLARVILTQPRSKQKSSKVFYVYTLLL